MFGLEYLETALKSTAKNKTMDNLAAYNGFCSVSDLFLLQF